MYLYSEEVLYDQDVFASPKRKEIIYNIANDNNVSTIKSYIHNLLKEIKSGNTHVYNQYDEKLYGIIRKETHTEKFGRLSRLYRTLTTCNNSIYLNLDPYNLSLITRVSQLMEDELGGYFIISYNTMTVETIKIQGKDVEKDYNTLLTQLKKLNKLRDVLNIKQASISDT